MSGRAGRGRLSLKILETRCGTARLRRKLKENQKAKGKNQKAKMSAPGRGPDWGGIFRGWPQSKQSSMTQSSMSQFLSGAGSYPQAESSRRAKKWDFSGTRGPADQAADGVYSCGSGDGAPRQHPGRSSTPHNQHVSALPPGNQPGARNRALSQSHSGEGQQAGSGLASDQGDDPVSGQPGGGPEPAVPVWRLLGAGRGIRASGPPVRGMPAVHHRVSGMGAGLLQPRAPASG